MDSERAVQLGDMGTAARLFGRRASFFATAVFALLGTSLHLGAFATTDAMSLFLVALAAWCVIRAGDREPASGWLVAAAVVLALAVATAYTCLLFAPLIAALALLTAPHAGRGWLAARRAGTLLAATAALLAVGLGVGGGSYLGGFERTMLTRAPGSATPLAVLGQSWSWAALVLVLAIAGVVISCASRQGAAQAWLLGFLSAALPRCAASRTTAGSRIRRAAPTADPRPDAAQQLAPPGPTRRRQHVLAGAAGNTCWQEKSPASAAYGAFCAVGWRSVRPQFAGLSARPPLCHDGCVAYDDGLAARLLEILGEQAGLAEKKMFGGLAMMLNGNMAVGVYGDDLLVRTDPGQQDLLLPEPGTRPFDMAGRPMKGWIVVAASMCSEDEDLRRWVSRGVAYASSLPPK